MLGDKTAFLNQYAIPEKMYEEAGMSWADLEAIAEDYAYRVDGFYMIRDMFLKELIENKEDETGLHSYRTRIKTPGHLVEKIIRRRVENYRKYKDLTKENYLKFVTDIIGFRGLLLYREDWVVFHKYLLKHFENHASWYVHDCLKDFDESRDRYMVEAPRYICARGILRTFMQTGSPAMIFMIRNITVPCIIFSNTAACTWRCRSGRCLRRGGEKSIITFFTPTKNRIRC